MLGFCNTFQKIHFFDNLINDLWSKIFNFLKNLDVNSNLYLYLKESINEAKIWTSTEKSIPSSCHVGV